MNLKYLGWEQAKNTNWPIKPCTYAYKCVCFLLHLHFFRLKSLTPAIPNLLLLLLLCLINVPSQIYYLHSGTV